jgi:hypothetical protein
MPSTQTSHRAPGPPKQAAGLRRTAHWPTAAAHAALRCAFRGFCRDEDVELKDILVHLDFSRLD